MEFARAGGFIIFDSLQDWYSGLNENDNAQMALLMRKFTALARLGAGVLILHHVPAPRKDQDVKLWRGATAIVAATDMAVSLTKGNEAEEANTFHLGCIRFRPCAEWDLAFKIKWDDREIGLSLVSDSNAAQVGLQKAQIRADNAAKKKREKASATYELALGLEELIIEDTNISLQNLAKETTVGRNRIPELMKLRGWKKAKGIWVQDKGKIKPHPGAMKSPSSDTAVIDDGPSAEDLECF